MGYGSGGVVGYSLDSPPALHRANRQLFTPKGQIKVAMPPLPQMHVFGLWGEPEYPDRTYTDTGRTGKVHIVILNFKSNSYI